VKNKNPEGPISPGFLFYSSDLSFKP